MDLPEDAYHVDSEQDAEGHDCLPESKSWASSWSDGDWAPLMTWWPAMPVEDVELLGDESKIVRERLDIVDEVPANQWMTQDPWCPAEVMRSVSVANFEVSSRREVTSESLPVLLGCP